MSELKIYIMPAGNKNYARVKAIGTEKQKICNFYS